MSEFIHKHPLLNQLSYKTTVDLLRITVLVYNYGREMYMSNPNDTVDAFVEGLRQRGEFDNLHLNETRKKVLEDIAYNVPSGKLVKFIQDTETDIQVGITICETERRICVIFRGSDMQTDFCYDLTVTKHKLTEKIRVHSGFYNQLTKNNVYNKLVSEVKKLLDKYPTCALYVTGHSLGGALATLFGYMLSNEIAHQIMVISFASPRVGNYDWKQAFDAKTNLTHYRITNNRDVVTAFPMYRYYHVGHNLKLLEKDYCLISRDAQRNWYEETYITCWSASDHSCETYYDRLMSTEW
jgi:hypothetical protein